MSPRRPPFRSLLAAALLTAVSAARAQGDVALADPVPVPIARPAVDTTLIALIREDAIAFENGEGVPRDGARAAALYCKAARLGDAASQYALGWMYSNGRGVERSDATAAFFFHAAAEQGWPQAIRMLDTVGGPSAELPECMRTPAPAVVAATRPASPARRVVVVPAYEAPANAPSHIVDLARRTATELRVQPELVLAIIEAESNFNTAALSPKNAKGLMQLIPETAARFNVTRPYDPAQNIRGGVSYLRWLLAYFEGDVALVAAAYNAGEGAVDRYRGVPPYAETLAYVAKVLRRTGATEVPYDGAATGASPQIRSIRAARR